MTKSNSEDCPVCQSPVWEMTFDSGGMRIVHPDRIAACRATPEQTTEFLRVPLELTENE